MERNDVRAEVLVQLCGALLALDLELDEGEVGMVHVEHRSLVPYRVEAVLRENEIA